MPSRIEDYALIGDRHTGALVSREGSIDWLCVPRFDSDACFAALLGSADHGRWCVRPTGEVRENRRRYRPDTLILETDFETDHGAVRLIDFMPRRTRSPQVVRTVLGLGGRVEMSMEAVIRFNYGAGIPWVRGQDGAISAVAGPDALYLSSDVELRGEDLKTVADFTVAEGQRVSFVLLWHPSYRRRPPVVDPNRALADTEKWWRRWAGRCSYDGPWRDAVVRSVITLKALTYAPTGGIAAALTTSLPEQLGGERNWDYRYCWLRDATFSLYALLSADYEEEACAWRDWMVRAVAGDPSQVQTLYGIDGQRRLAEIEIPWLEGYERSAPVRIGNAASSQLQLDIFGEVMDAMHLARRRGIHPDENAWRVQKEMLKHLEEIWRQPDEGIWEIRGPRQQLTHSKVMVWVAFDRAVKAVEQDGLAGPVDRWRKLRQAVHDEVCAQGFDRRRNAFVQSYGSDDLDASLLMMPMVGFLPAGDSRVQGTIQAIQRELTRDGLVMRYATGAGFDGLAGDEGAFLLCSFWLADALVLGGQRQEAQTLFERLLSLRNDVGLLSEEYDAATGRFLGNYPQAFSHVALVNTAMNLAAEHGPSAHRARH
jgi:GH15 family glucan-1,4-alpha-glucosidase